MTGEESMNLSKGRQPEHCEYGRLAHGTQICQLVIETEDAALPRQGYLIPDGQELKEEGIVDIVFGVSAPSKWFRGIPSSST
ncbi:hypothetical protein N7445_005315 [Penicillium cf. griseofulvum]|nr:hypothetical protein N7445_005315 [Penicillium cf. griseofulvum]